jgi:bifunctional non-homologous end joining protein LigD
VLLSWAATKGPSVDPADKRLAVRTEDHPLAHGSFEGTIPKGEYGGGTVMLWDRGSWTPKGDPHAGLKKGHLAFELQGERLKGRWNLVRMRGDEKRENGEVLEGLASSVTTGQSVEEIARAAIPTKGRKSDPKAAARLKRPMDRYTEVQLATLVDRVPEGENGFMRSSSTATDCSDLLPAALPACGRVMEMTGRNVFRLSCPRCRI